MLYKHSVTGDIYRGLDNAFVVLNKDGRVAVKIGDTDHSYNFINLEAFEHCLKNGQVSHFKLCYEHLADAILKKGL